LKGEKNEKTVRSWRGLVYKEEKEKATQRNQRRGGHPTAKKIRHRESITPQNRQQREGGTDWESGSEKKKKKGPHRGGVKRKNDRKARLSQSRDDRGRKKKSMILLRGKGVGGDSRNEKKK